MIKIDTLKKLGSERSGDTLTSDKSAELLQRSLAWIGQNLNIDSASSIQDPSLKNLYNLALDSSVIVKPILQGQSPIDLVNLQKNSVTYLATNILTGGSEVLQGRNLRKWATVFTGMAGGVTLGALLGTVLFPGPGTAAGAYLGGVISSVGGGVGMAFILGSFGTWVGNKIGKRFEANPQDYTISKDMLQTIEKVLPIGQSTICELNAYITNRIVSVKEPRVKDALKMLKEVALTKPTPEGAERLIYFLAQEFVELTSLKNPKKPHLADLEFIKSTLSELNKKTKLGDLEKTYIDSILNPSKAQTQNPHPEKRTKPDDGVGVDHHDKPKSVLTAARENATHTSGVGLSSTGIPKIQKEHFARFEQKSKEYVAQSVNNFSEVIKSVQANKDEPGNRAIVYQYKFKDDKPAPFHLNHKESTSEKGIAVELSTKLVGKTLPSVQAQVIVLQMKAYLEEAGFELNHPITLMANKNPEVAIELMATALKEGLKPTLDMTEFPDETVRSKIIHEANLRLGDIEPKPESIGFRL